MGRFSVILTALLFTILPFGDHSAQALTKGDTSRQCHDGAFGGRAVCIHADRYFEDVCSAIGVLATAEGLPRGFFARLIWQESGFNSRALSPKGAQGIAQFMPGTAKIRGLKNPYNPAAALAASAAYLGELKREFGNLGLAAAAYNAGEGRVRRILAGKSRAPSETRHYVSIITGHSVDDWVSGQPKAVQYRLNTGATFHDACVTMAQKRKFRGFGPAPKDRKPWGVEIATHNSAATARKLFKEVQTTHENLLSSHTPTVVKRRAAALGGGAPKYSAQIARLDQGGAISLCRKLRRSGAVCRVVRN